MHPVTSLPTVQEHGSPTVNCGAMSMWVYTSIVLSPFIEQVFVGHLHIQDALSLSIDPIKIANKSTIY